MVNTIGDSLISGGFAVIDKASGRKNGVVLYDVSEERIQQMLPEFASDRSGMMILDTNKNLITCTGSGATPAFLSDMVRQVNENDVAPEEVLSDQIYYYRKDEKRLGMILAPGCVRFPLRPAGRL